ncbi:MAG: AraC family transcriptional regulator, partial [Firmicutes bacterium HGW-Firmicutes-21]
RRLFERVYEMPPVKYIKMLRMENAKRLLETGFYSVNEVAFRSGFASASYFSTEFKRDSGVTPREYYYISRL